MATVLEGLVEQLEVCLENAKSEISKFESGKKNAALKVRKEAQESKNLWQEVRVTVMEQLKSMPTKKKEK